MYKYAANLSSENHPKTDLVEHCKNVLHRITQKGFDKMLEEQSQAWSERWRDSDIMIAGDVAAQQGIRFNIFQLHQTYKWEITFEEIHRNGAIAYAIYDYINYTNDYPYLAEYGLEVLIAIARFWAQRVNYSEDKQAYVMLGVTGPNEYENNVNNNWYTNYTAKKCLKYALVTLDVIKKHAPKPYAVILEKTNFDEVEEPEMWWDIIGNIYQPKDEKRGIFLQQDGFLDKDIQPASTLSEAEQPICQKWSWDRIGFCAPAISSKRMFCRACIFLKMTSRKKFIAAILIFMNH